MNDTEYTPVKISSTNLVTLTPLSSLESAKQNIKQGLIVSDTLGYERTAKLVKKHKIRVPKYQIYIECDVKDLNSQNECFTAIEVQQREKKIKNILIKFGKDTPKSYKTKLENNLSVGKVDIYKLDIKPEHYELRRHHDKLIKLFKASSGIDKIAIAKVVVMDEAANASTSSNTSIDMLLDIALNVGGKYASQLVKYGVDINTKTYAARAGTFTFNKSFKAIRDDKGKYLTPLDRSIVDDNLILCRAGMGTGKTKTLLTSFIEHSIKSYAKAVIITHRISLIHQLNEDLQGLTDIQVYDKTKRLGVEKGTQVIITTEQSLTHRNIQKFINDNDCYIAVDECLQVVKDLYRRCDPTKSSSSKGFEQLNALRNAISSAKGVLGLDAQLNKTVTDWFSSIRRQEAKIIYKPSLPSGKTYTINHHDTRKSAFTSFVGDVLGAVENDVKPWIVLELPKEAESLALMIKQQNPEKRVIVVTGESKSKGASTIQQNRLDALKFAENPDKYLSNYDVVISNHTIASGVSVDTKNYIDVVIGFSDGHMSDANGFYQQTGRVRDCKKVVLHTARCTKADKDFYKSSAEFFTIISRVTDKIYKENQTDTDHSQYIDLFYKEFEISRANISETLIMLANESSHKVEVITRHDTTTLDEIQTLIELNTSVVSEEWQSKTLNAETIDATKFNALKAAPPSAITEGEAWSMHQYVLSRIVYSPSTSPLPMGLHDDTRLTENEYKFAQSKGSGEYLLRYAALVSAIMDAKGYKTSLEVNAINDWQYESDEDQKISPSSIRKLSRFRHLKSVITAVFGKEFLSEQEFSLDRYYLELAIDEESLRCALERLDDKIISAVATKLIPPRGVYADKAAKIIESTKNPESLSNIKPVEVKRPYTVISNILSAMAPVKVERAGRKPKEHKRKISFCGRGVIVDVGHILTRAVTQGAYVLRDKADHKTVDDHGIPKLKEASKFTAEYWVKLYYDHCEIAKRQVTDKRDMKKLARTLYSQATGEKVEGGTLERLFSRVCDELEPVVRGNTLKEYFDSDKQPIQPVKTFEFITDSELCEAVVNYWGYDVTGVKVQKVYEMLTGKGLDRNRAQKLARAIKDFG